MFHVTTKRISTTLDYELANRSCNGCQKACHGREIPRGVCIFSVAEEYIYIFVSVDSCYVLTLATNFESSHIDNIENMMLL